MSVFKRFRGKKITAKDKNWNKGTWVMWKRLNGRIIHKTIPEAQTKEQAELAERYIIQQAFNNRYGITPTVNFEDFANGSYTRYFEHFNTNIGAKRLYVAKLCKALKGKTLDAITPQDCRDIQANLKRETSASSVNRIMSTASRLFSLACEEGVLDRNPMQFVKMLKEPPPRSRLLTEKEKERLWVELGKDGLLARLVSLALSLPLRRGQLLAITPDAIDFQHGVISVIASKGRGKRLLPLNSIAMSTLQTMKILGELPFPLKDFRKRWSKALLAAGINEKDGKRGENFTFHDLRHCLASELVNRYNVNPETVRKLYGHSDMSITQVYMNADFEVLRTALNSLDATNLQRTIDEGDFVN